jgi:hypothetical protein
VVSEICDLEISQKGEGRTEKRALYTSLGRDYTQIQDEASSQNMIMADVALSAQARKANAVASSYLPQGSWGYLLQKSESLNRITTPPAEHDAANDRIAVTCMPLMDSIH